MDAGDARGRADRGFPGAGAAVRGAWRSCCRTCRRPTAPNALAAKIERHEHGPICSVHLWFDREITELEHAVLLDREIHWMYNKSRLQPGRKAKGSYLELVVSASQKFAALEPRRGDRSGRARAGRSFFPLLPKRKLEKAALVKEVRATFTVPPGSMRRGRVPRFTVAELRSGRRLDSRPAGPRRWRAPRAAGIWPRKPSARQWASRGNSHPDLKPRGLCGS